MKKRIIIVLVIIVAIIVGLSIWVYAASFHKVQFVIKPTNVTVRVFKDDFQVESITTAESTVSLQNGIYYYSVVGKKFDGTRYKFTVEGKEMTVTVAPDYSPEYLSALLATEKAGIEKMINDTYPFTAGKYEIFNENLYKNGEWFGAIIKKIIDPRDITDPYRIIMNKRDGKWTMIHYPEIVVTKTNFPGVPIEILTAVNDLKSTKD